MGPIMIDKLLLQLDGSLGGMNIHGNVVETLLTGSHPMPSQEGGVSQVNDNLVDKFWDKIVGETDES